jgi:hypothetical protein
VPTLAPTRQPRPLLVEIGAGELIDKITILRIKAARITDAGRLANVERELSTLEAARRSALPPHPELTELEDELMSTNEQLWAIEDDIRLHEAAGDFGAGFIALARAVYKTNDRRAALKKSINLLTGAAIVEEKSYAGAA